MSEKPERPMFDTGDKILVVTRRLFSEDVRRHFVGIVDRAGTHAVRAHGYAFIIDETLGGEFVRHKGQRTRVFPLDNQLVIFVLPDDVEIERVKYERRESKELLVTDGKNFRIDMTEFGA